MIEFINVSHTYRNDYEVLKDVNFTVHAGEILIISGPSGAGKSSIFNLLMRLQNPSRGEIFVNRCNIASLSKKELPHLRRYMGMIFQHPHLLPNENVFYNVALPLQVGGYRSEYINHRVTSALKKVGLLDKSGSKVMDLSSGEQKLVEIARAIVTLPKILLVDEPTANVDAPTVMTILKLFRNFNEMGITIIVATHHDHLMSGPHVRSLRLRDGSLTAVEQKVEEK